MIRNFWRSIDTHVQNVAGSVLLCLFSIKVAYTSLKNVCNQSPLRLPMMQDQKSLAVSWLSVSWWGTARVSLHFDYKPGLWIKKWQWHTKASALQWTVGYQNATIHRKACEPDLEMNTNGSIRTRQTRQVDTYGYWLGLPPCHWSRCLTALEPNWMILRNQTWTAGRLLRLIANTSSRCSFHCQNSVDPKVSHTLRLKSVDRMTIQYKSHNGEISDWLIYTLWCYAQSPSWWSKSNGSLECQWYTQLRYLNVCIQMYTVRFWHWPLKTIYIIYFSLFATPDWHP